MGLSLIQRAPFSIINGTFHAFRAHHKFKLQQGNDSRHAASVCVQRCAQCGQTHWYLVLLVFVICVSAQRCDDCEY